MLNIKCNPSPLFATADAVEGEEAAEAGEGDFNWHCKGGLAKNIQTVKDEFCKERGLKPFKISINGKPCAGKSFFSKQLAEHFNIPHIHKEQVMQDIQEWNAEKQREYEFKQSEKKRLTDLADQREKERVQAEAEAEEEKKRLAAEEKERLRAEKGSDYESGDEAAAKEESDKPADEPAEDEEKEKKSEAPKSAKGSDNGDDAGKKSEAQVKFEQQLAALEAEEGESEEEFSPLDIKLRINTFKKEHPEDKKIPSALLSEAFRWRMGQNDCQNRGYVLDGYPISYQTATDVFFITPVQPKKADKTLNADGEEEEAPVDEGEEEDAAKYTPKFQKHIYPDSVILIRGDDDELRARGEKLKAEDNLKWDRETLERRLTEYRANNDISLF